MDNSTCANKQTNMATPEKIITLPFDDAVSLLLQGHSEEELRRVRTAARGNRTRSRTKLRQYRESYELNYPEPDEEEQAEFELTEASLLANVQAASEYLRRVEYAYDVKTEVITSFQFKRGSVVQSFHGVKDPDPPAASKLLVQQPNTSRRELSPMTSNFQPQRAPQVSRDDIYPADSVSQAPDRHQAFKNRGRDPSKVKLADLTRASDLRNHITFAEMAFGEADLGVYSQGNFMVKDNVKVAVLTNFLSSLKDPTVKLSADHAVRTTNFSWHAVMDILTSRFCRPEVMRMEFERQLSRLQFNGPSRVDEFIQQSILIYQSCTVAYNDQSECKSAVRSIFKKLPSGLREKLITRVYLESAISCDDEWELALSFDASVSTSMGKSMCDCLKDICRIEELAFMASTSYGQQQPRVHHYQDKVKYTSTRMKPSEFAHKHSVVLYLGGSGISNRENTEKLLSKIASQHFTSFHGKPYYLLGFKDKHTADSFRSNVGQGYVVKDHELFRGKSAQAASDRSVTGTPLLKN
jgi:hypothetical protein